MTITPATLYWITRLDNLCGLFTLIVVLGIAALVITIIAYFANEPYDDVKASYHRWMKGFSITVFTILILGMFIPSSKEIAMFYVVPRIAESDVIKRDVPELYNMGVDALKDWLKINTETKEN